MVFNDLSEVEKAPLDIKPKITTGLNSCVITLLFVFFFFKGLLLLMLSFTKDLMKGTRTLEECLELEFILQRTLQRATNMCMG